MFRIYVTDEQGSRLSLARAAARWLAEIFLAFFGGALVSLLTIATTAKKQAVHDMVASTLVVEGRPSEAGGVELWRWLAAFALSFVWIFGSDMIAL
jgi:uncharacterized RDD family membrane protein YckC